MGKSIWKWAKANKAAGELKYQWIFLIAFYICNRVGPYFQELLAERCGAERYYALNVLTGAALVIMVGIVFENIKKFLGSGEITFLKGLSYSNFQILIIGFLKQRNCFWMFSAVFGILHFKISFVMIILNFFYYVLLYIAILALSFLFFYSSRRLAGILRWSKLEKCWNVVKDTIYQKKWGQGKLAAHLLKDYFSLARNAGFVILQSLSLLVIVLLLFFNNDFEVYLAVGIVIVCLNSLYSQELYKIEADNFMLYKQLPVKYKEFVKAKIISVFCLSTYQFVLIFLLKGIFNPEIFLVIGMLLVLALFLSIYYNSLLTMYYPEIEKTDVPILIWSMFILIPILPFILIWVAYKKGRKKWDLNFCE